MIQAVLLYKMRTVFATCGCLAFATPASGGVRSILSPRDVGPASCGHHSVKARLPTLTGTARIQNG